MRPTAKNRLPASHRRWLTRADVCAEYPISYCVLASLPPSLLPSGESGKSAVYDRADVDALFNRLKGRRLADLIAEAEAAHPRRPRGRPRARGGEA